MKLTNDQTQSAQPDGITVSPKVSRALNNGFDSRKDESEIDHSQVDHSQTEELREPCPTPLAWQQVLDVFRSESSRWKVDCKDFTVQGRTWGHGPPLYFLGGMTGDHELFALANWLLREDFRCVLIDYPNFKPKSSGNETSISDYAAALFRVADSQGDSRFHVYATEFGSAVLLAALLDQPQRIDLAIIQNGFAHRKLSLCERLLIKACRLWPGSLRGIPGRKSIQQQNHRLWFPPYDFTRWEFYLRNTGQTPVATMARRAMVLKELDLRSQLPLIQNSIHLLRAEGDGRIAAQCQNELLEALPNASSEELHTTGQLTHLTHPHRFAKIVKEFLLERSA